MTKEQEDYIKLEESAKKWINETDEAQFDTYELLAMFAAKEIEKLFSLASVNFSEADLKVKLAEQKEEIRQWLIDEDFEGLAERL